MLNPEREIFGEEPTLEKGSGEAGKEEEKMDESESMMKTEMAQGEERENKEKEIKDFVIQPISKEANKFHFLSNLTEWHFSYTKEYNEYWLEKTGKLSEQEKEAISDFRSILEKYNYGEKFLGKPFIATKEEDVWSQVKGLVEPEEFERIEKDFKIISPRFEKLWQEEYPLLIKKKEEIEQYLREIGQEKLIKLHQDLSSFYKTERPKFKENVFLLMNTGELVSGGGANVGEGNITWECSHLDLKEEEVRGRKLAGIYHEYLHDNYERDHFDSLKEDYFKNVSEEEQDNFRKLAGMPLETAVGESITSSLLPEGYLAEKYFNVETIEKIQQSLEKAETESEQKEILKEIPWRDFTAVKLYPIIKEYIENKKPVDETYFKKAHEAVKECFGLNKLR